MKDDDNLPVNYVRAPRAGILSESIDPHPVDACRACKRDLGKHPNVERLCVENRRMAEALAAITRMSATRSVRSMMEIQGIAEKAVSGVWYG